MSGNWIQYFNELGLFLNEQFSHPQPASESLCEYTIDTCRSALEVLDGICYSLQQHINQSPSESDSEECAIIRSRVLSLMECIREVGNTWEQNLIRSRTTSAVAFGLRVPLEHQPLGRPRYALEQDQVLYLIELSFTWNDIATIV